MPATTLHRLGLGLVSTIAAISLAACGSDTTSGNPVSNSATGSSQSASGGSESTTASSDGTSAAGSDDASSSTGDAASFCQAYNLDIVKNAGTDPKAARDVLEKVAEVAPAEIKSDAELIFDVLDKSLAGTPPTQSSTEIREASARVATYYAQNCQ